MKRSHFVAALSAALFLHFAQLLMDPAVAQINVNPKQKKEYSSNGDIELISVPATSTQPGGGTSPDSGAKVSAGQIVTLGILFADTDQSRVPGGVWNDFKAPVEWGTYEIQVSLTNATFTNTDKTSDTFVAIRVEDGRAFCPNIFVTVDPQLAGDQSVSVAIQVTDNVIIPRTPWLWEHLLLLVKIPQRIPL